MQFCVLWLETYYKVLCVLKSKYLRMVSFFVFIESNVKGFILYHQDVISLTKFKCTITPTLFSIKVYDMAAIISDHL